jgi:hypothetical protein
MEYVVVVGFHHQVGSQIEYLYPQKQSEELTSEFIGLLPSLALPDGSHITEAGYVYFILRNS